MFMKTKFRDQAVDDIGRKKAMLNIEDLKLFYVEV